MTCLALLVLFLSVRSPLWAQAQNTGSILGSIVDPTKAAIPFATVTVVETDKGINRSVQASKEGEYLLPSLPVGHYQLTVSAPGFATYEADDIIIDADKSVKIVIRMTVGDSKETVTVSTAGTALDTNSATIGTLIDNKLVEDLPIDGRNVVALAGLLPGVTDLNAPATNTSDRGGPTYSVSGSRNTQNLMLFDGLMWNNLFFNTGINYPPPNGLQEISVLLNNFKAQYGRNAGSVFNVVTKSGTNTIHGAIWDYFQNSALNAHDYLTRQNPKDNSNQLGFSVQGPIKRDKLYFAITFGDLIQRLSAVGSAVYAQGYAERGLNPDGLTARLCTTGVYPAGTACASYATEVAPLPYTAPLPPGVTAPAQSYGKFLNPEIISSTSGPQAQSQNTVQMLNAASVQAGGPANNPCNALLTSAITAANTIPYFGGKVQGTYLPYAEVPVQCLNPVLFGQPGNGNLFSPATKLATRGVINTYVPLPNAFTPKGQPEATTSAPQPRNDRNALIRVDWVASDRHRIDARYNLIVADDATAPGVNSSSQGVPTFELSANHSVSNFGNIGDTWVVTPNILNVLRLGYKRYTFQTPPFDHTTLNDFGGNFVEPGTKVMPTINASDDYRLGSTSQANSNVVNENIELLEQLSWTKGKHNLQFGANYLRLQYLNRTDYPGNLGFSTDFTGLSVGDEAFGLLDNVQANSPLVQGGIQNDLFLYAQDDWRILPRLTVNLGLRYELPYQWYQPNGYASTFIPGFQSTRFPAAIGGLAYPGDQGVRKSLVPTDFNGIAPRFGFAYDVFGTGRFVVRGGGGLFFDAINADVIGVGEPFYFQYYNQLPVGGFSVPLQNYPTTSTSTKGSDSVRVIPSGYDKANPQFVAPYSLFYPDRNFRTPYYESFNFGVQYQVLRGGVLDVNYVGKLGRKLTIPYDQNPAIYDCSGGYFQANPQLYCTGASNSINSTRARLRYTPFNYGGGGLVDFASIGTSNYNALQAQYTQRSGKLLTLLMSYTYSKSIDLQTQTSSLNGTASPANVIPNVFNLASDRGLSDYDARHIFNMGWVVSFPKVRMGSPLFHDVVNGWQYGGKFITHTGKPFSVLINNDSALDGEPNQRAAIVPGANPLLPKTRHRVDKVNEYFNIYAFTYPTPGTFSPVHRNAFTGPGYIQTDMNFGRSFSLANIREGMRVLVRVEAFNVFNTPNLAQPSAKFSCTSTQLGGGPCIPTNLSGGASASNAPGFSPTSTFGQILSTFGNNANTSTNGRKLQVSLTTYF
jgi:outer membrane receptor protein involved in Fe transport